MPYAGLGQRAAVKAAACWKVGTSSQSLQSHRAMYRFGMQDFGCTGLGVPSPASGVYDCGASSHRASFCLLKSGVIYTLNLTRKLGPKPVWKG